MCSECRANKSKSLSRAARSCFRPNTCCESSRTCELVLQFNATEQLSICSHDDGRRAHRNGSYAHGAIKSPVHEKTAGNQDRDEVVTRDFVSSCGSSLGIIGLPWRHRVDRSELERYPPIQSPHPFQHQLRFSHRRTRVPARR
jgi:hypothetical protein